MLRSSSRASDLFIALFVVAITVLLLIPVPTFLLDVLLSVNLCVSLLLLLIGLYSPNALALLAFPSLLLLTTLFRLSLNVASTRLILTYAEAGRVIDAFGTFLIRGEVVVGLIIFAIISVVNFIVIARGASRVSEVAARFALDAMPGKQMAIDSDLRSGGITREEAEKRRDALRKESQLYGAMDGAMKFVQGDVIAGFFIVFVNIVGGFYQGLSAGRPFSEVVHVYTVLTVGDGLVSQIPALMTSICAGIVVTRVSSGENTTLGADLGAQLFRRPGTVVFSGLLLMLVGLVPGLPHVAFLSVGAVFAISGLVLSRREKPSMAAMVSGQDKLALLPGKFENLPAPDSDGGELEFTLDGALLYRMFRLEAAAHLNWWNRFRQDFASETGLDLPALRVLPDDALAPCSFEICSGGVVVDRGRVPVDSLLIELNPVIAPVFGLEPLMEADHPINGSRVFWAAQTSRLRNITEAAGIRCLDFMQYIFLRAAKFVNDNPDEILSLSRVGDLLRDLEQKKEGLLGEPGRRHFVSLPRFTEILRELVKEGLGAQDFRQIVEAVAAYCSSYGVSPDQPENFDLHDIVSYVRISRRRQLLSRLLGPRRTLKAVIAGEETEALLKDAHFENGTLGMPPEDFERLRDSFDNLIKPLRLRGVMPVALLCSREARPKASGFLRSCGQPAMAVCFDELTPQVPVEAIGVW